MPLPTCQCNNGLPVQQQLANIYCALYDIVQNGGGGGSGNVTAAAPLDSDMLVIGQGGSAIATMVTGTGVIDWLQSPTAANLAALTGDKTGTGNLVFATAPTFNGAVTLAENASVALDPSLSADGRYTGITIAGTAGTTLAFGDLIYLAVADSRWELVDADSVTTAGAVLTGMCVLAAAADGSPTVVLLQGNIRADANFPTLTVGAPVYASTTPGDIQVAQPSGTDDVIQVVGYALTADSIYFDPSKDYITHT